MFKKKLVSILLSIVMIICLLPFNQAVAAAMATVSINVGETYEFKNSSGETKSN